MGIKTAFIGIASLLVLAPACAVDDAPDDDGFRIIDGTEVTARNGAVQLRVPKKKEQITDPKKAHWYCTGALIAPDCVVTAGHCINNVGADNWIATGDVWHPEKTNNGDNGRPVPAEGETVSKITKIAVQGEQHKDLAVLKLETKLPEPLLKLAKATPALDKTIHVLGNGQTEKGDYAHRETDMKLIAIDSAATEPGYESLKLEQIAKGGMTTFGDSGGPAIFAGVVGVGSRYAGTKTTAYYASTTATKSREWLDAKIKEVCGIDTPVDDGTTTGEDSSTGDASSETGGGSSGGGSSGGGGTTGFATTDDGTSWAGEDDPSWGESGGFTSDGSTSTSDGGTTSGSSFTTDATFTGGETSTGSASTTIDPSTSDGTTGATTIDVGTTTDVVPIDVDPLPVPSD